MKNSWNLRNNSSCVDSWSDLWSDKHHSKLILRVLIGGRQWLNFILRGTIWSALIIIIWPLATRIAMDIAAHNMHWYSQSDDNLVIIIMLSFNWIGITMHLQKMRWDRTMPSNAQNKCSHSVFWWDGSEIAVRSPQNRSKVCYNTTKAP